MPAARRRRCLTDSRVRLERPDLRLAVERGDVRQGSRDRIDEIARSQDALIMPRLHEFTAVLPAALPRQSGILHVERRGESVGGRRFRGFGFEKGSHDRSEAGQGFGPDGAAAWTAEERRLAWRGLFSGWDRPWWKDSPPPFRATAESWFQDQWRLMTDCHNARTTNSPRSFFSAASRI
jgi:hypothetical protein